MLCIKSTSDFEIESVKYPNFPLLTWEVDNSDLGIESGIWIGETFQKAVKMKC